MMKQFKYVAVYGATAKNLQKKMQMLCAATGFPLKLPQILYFVELCEIRS